MKIKISALLVSFLLVSQLFASNIFALGTQKGVTEKGYDDIGAILTAMGDAYSYNTITNENLADSNFDLSSYNQLFINCSSGISSSSGGAKTRLQNWVSSGGALYASDWAFDFIDKAFPGHITFTDNPYSGESQNITSSVVDSGLSWYLNPLSPMTSLDLTFDLGGWVVIKSIAKDTTVYLRGNVTTYSGTLTNTPLTVAFKYGKGRVIYTSFHNEAQLSDSQQKLLKYLILIPSAASLSNTLEEWLQTFSPDVEILAENINTINQGETSQAFSYTASGGENLIFADNWGGSALKLSVYKPDGSLYSEVESNSPPAKINVANATAGKWTYTVNAVSVPHASYPYVVLVAKSKIATSIAVSAKPKSIKKGATAKIVGKLTGSSSGLSGKKLKLLKKVIKAGKKKVKGIIKTVKKVTWQTVAAGKTDKKGKFSFTVKPKVSTIFEVKFAGDAKYSEKTSKAVKVTVK